MLKAFGFIFGGFGLSISGFYVFFTSIQSMAAQKGGWLIILFPFLVGAGVFLLIKGSHARKGFSLEVAEGTANPGLETKIQKNNQYMEEWNKTNNTRDKLKTLQYQAAVDVEEAEKNTAG